MYRSTKSSLDQILKRIIWLLTGTALTAFEDFARRGLRRGRRGCRWPSFPRVYRAKHCQELLGVLNVNLWTLRESWNGTVFVFILQQNIHIFTFGRLLRNVVNIFSLLIADLSSNGTSRLSWRSKVERDSPALPSKFWRACQCFSTCCRARSDTAVKELILVRASLRHFYRGSKYKV